MVDHPLPPKPDTQGGSQIMGLMLACGAEKLLGPHAMQSDSTGRGGITEELRSQVGVGGCVCV
jgi:hypothetical protein